MTGLRTLHSKKSKTEQSPLQQKLNHKLCLTKRAKNSNPYMKTISNHICRIFRLYLGAITIAVLKNIETLIVRFGFTDTRLNNQSPLHLFVDVGVILFFQCFINFVKYQLVGIVAVISKNVYTAFFIMF